MGLLDRLRGRRRAPRLPDLADDGTLTVLVASFDAARADSAVLAEAGERGVDLSAPVLVRHHLVGLPDGAAVQRAADLLGQDGYRLTVLDGPPYAVRAWRTQVLTPLAASQERSRMAGLAQRLGGDVLGYDVLGPDTSGPDTLSPDTSGPDMSGSDPVGANQTHSDVRGPGGPGRGAGAGREGSSQATTRR